MGKIDANNLKIEMMASNLHSLVQNHKGFALGRANKEKYMSNIQNLMENAKSNMTNMMKNKKYFLWQLHVF